MKLSELNEIKNSLAKLLQAPGIPAKAAYRAAKFSKAVANEIKELEEARVKLVKQFGSPDDNGNVQVAPERMDEFNEAFDEILKEEVDIPVHKITVDDVKNAQLTLLDFANLDFLFEDVPTKE